jgi:hypothetical protein
MKNSMAMENLKAVTMEGFNASCSNFVSGYVLPYNAAHVANKYRADDRVKGGDTAFADGDAESAALVVTTTPAFLCGACQGCLFEEIRLFLFNNDVVCCCTSAVATSAPITQPSNTGMTGSLMVANKVETTRDRRYTSRERGGRSDRSEGPKLD